jgi:hypothetical protein
MLEPKKLVYKIQVSIINCGWSATNRGDELVRRPTVAMMPLAVA